MSDTLSDFINSAKKDAFPNGNNNYIYFSQGWNSAIETIEPKIKEAVKNILNKLQLLREPIKEDIASGEFAILQVIEDSIKEEFGEGLIHSSPSRHRADEGEFNSPVDNIQNSEDKK